MCCCINGINTGERRLADGVEEASLTLPGRGGHHYSLSQRKEFSLLHW